MKQLKADIESANMSVDSLNVQVAESQSSVKFLEDQISNLNIELAERESEIRQMVDERAARDREFEDFSTEVEKRTQIYKSILDDKERELTMTTRKYENLIEQLPAGFDVDSEQSEIRRLADLIHQRDELIKLLELKTSQLSEQVINSTELIGKLTRERDSFRERLTREKKDKCCEDIQAMLQNSNKRCEELQEMLVGVENENLLKSQQAHEAFEALKSYENSTDGLADALKKIHQLQESCHLKDLQIKDFVKELNAQNEVVAENAILRRRCGLPEDEIIETKAFLAKQKRNAKINERLTLKLHASEEMRLQLKLDKNELKRRIAVLESGNKESFSSVDEGEHETSTRRRQSSTSIPAVIDEIKKCEACCSSFNVLDSIKFCRNCIRRQNSSTLCDNCVSKFKTSNDENMELLRKIAKLEVNHKSIADENANLRIGLNEILEKLRDYEGTSERTVINPATLEKLIAILKLRSNVASTTLDDGVLLKSNEDDRMASPMSPVVVADSSSDKHVLQSEVDRLKEIISKLSDENDLMSTKLDQMKAVEQNYEELVRCSRLSDDEKHQLLVKSLERCHAFENNLAMYERKIEYLRNENDVLCNELKSIKFSAMETIHELEMQIYEKSNGLMDEIDIHNSSPDEEESIEIEALRSELQDVKSQLSSLCLHVLSTATSVDNQHRKFIENVSVVEKDLTSSVITRQELTDMEKKIATLEATIKKKESRERQLDELVRVMNTQFKSQQLLLSQCSDNEITTRHLIVDLQSRSNESHLIAKTTKELQQTKDHAERNRLEMEKMNEEIEMLRGKLSRSSDEFRVREVELLEQASQNELKLHYLQKTLVNFCNEYSSMTPIYLIADFIKDYSSVVELKNRLENEKNELKAQTIPPISLEAVVEQIRAAAPQQKITDIESRVEIIKYKSSCDYLKNQLDERGKIIRELHETIARAKCNEIRNEQHWNAIKMLFTDERKKEVATVSCAANVDEKPKEMHNKQTQVNVKKKDFGVNTDDDPPHTNLSSPDASVATTTVVEVEPVMMMKSPPPGDEEPLKSQLKKAMMMAQSRSVLLIETENRLSEAHGRVIALEKVIENREKQYQKEKDQLMESLKPKTPPKDDNMTISTLQKNLLEKDTTLSKYLDLLKAERQQHTKLNDELEEKIKSLKATIGDREATIEENKKSFDKLKKQLEEMHEKFEQMASHSKPSSPTRQQQQNDEVDQSSTLAARNRDLQTTVKQMEQQLHDMINTERQHQTTINERNNVIKELTSRLKSANTNIGVSLEIDQLRDLLEEKDRQIVDLTETLNQFHDDQQKYINDTAFNSAEQVQLMSSDLSRADLSNKVLKTQLEATKRQLVNIQTREKQARELLKTLKTQLIRRPVIAVKDSKRAGTAGEDNYQRRIRDLENELIETKDELRRQANINDNKRAKTAAELGLWDKSKRYQEQTEKLKTKLTESELEVERLKANLQMAKNTAVKYEKERNVLENKLKSDRYRQNVAIAQKSTGAAGGACIHCQKHHTTGYDSGASLLSEPISDMNSEIINTLKSRIESQQRKIVAMEFTGRGGNAALHDIEELHERLSSINADNMRLEAANAQLQIELDMLRQNEPDKQLEEKLRHYEK